MRDFNKNREDKKITTMNEEGGKSWNTSESDLRTIKRVPTGQNQKGEKQVKTTESPPTRVVQVVYTSVSSEDEKTYVRTNWPHNFLEGAS